MRNYSKRWSVNTQDFLRGLLIAVIVAFLTGVQQVFTQPVVNIDWSYIGSTTIVATIGYLIKQFMSAPPSAIKLNDETIINNQ